MYKTVVIFLQESLVYFLNHVKKNVLLKPVSQKEINILMHIDFNAPVSRKRYNGIYAVLKIMLQLNDKCIASKVKNYNVEIM